MDNKKQIEQIAKDLCKYHATDKCIGCNDYDNCILSTISEDLYKKGYRKQSKGRWKGAGLGDYYCSICNEEYSGGNKFKFCPNCGAKMNE